MPPPRPETPSDTELLRRLVELTYGLEQDAAELVVPVDGGVGVLNPSLPLLWDQSYLIVERPGLDARQVAELADRALGGHGLSRRTVAFLDPGEGRRVAPQLKRLGWTVDHGLYMVHRRAPELEVRAEVAERRTDEITGLLREVILDCFAMDYDGEPETVTDQFIAGLDAYEPVQDSRWFVASLDGVPSACCRLLSRAGLGEVEYVGTAARARNRGLARSAVLAAVEASGAHGHELTFLGADEDDWPQRLYERLGFEPIGTELAFLKRFGGGEPAPKRRRHSP
jgi:ribosomal protein S18 acetylase RimI-like enzyme